MESSPSFIKTAYQVLAIENDGKRSAVTFCYPAIKVLVGQRDSNSQPKDYEAVKSQKTKTTHNTRKQSQ